VNSDRTTSTRLQLDERRRQLIDAGSALFAQHAFEEIAMRQIAEAAGVCKVRLHHIASVVPASASANGLQQRG
jgi:AcrR family transcriptional regulator